MTKLTKTITRETLHTHDRGRPILVALEPGDVIAFRAKGTRRTWRTSLAACLWLAIRAEARAQSAENEKVRRRPPRRRS